MRRTIACVVGVVGTMVAALVAPACSSSSTGGGGSSSSGSGSSSGVSGGSSGGSSGSSSGSSTGSSSGSGDSAASDVGAGDSAPADATDGASDCAPCGTPYSCVASPSGQTTTLTTQSAAGGACTVGGMTLDCGGTGTAANGTSLTWSAFYDGGSALVAIQATGILLDCTPQ